MIRKFLAQYFDFFKTSEETIISTQIAMGQKFTLFWLFSFLVCIGNIIFVDIENKKFFGLILFGTLSGIFYLVSYVHLNNLFSNILKRYDLEKQDREKRDREVFDKCAKIVQKFLVSKICDYIPLGKNTGFPYYNNSNVPVDSKPRSSSCSRVGVRHNNNCSNIPTQNNNLPADSELISASCPQVTLTKYTSENDEKMNVNIISDLLSDEDSESSKILIKKILEICVVEDDNLIILPFDLIDSNKKPQQVKNIRDISNFFDKFQGKFSDLKKKIRIFVKCTKIDNRTFFDSMTLEDFIKK